MKAVILAGGGGTRLWPISRRDTPKQSQPFGDNETLMQKTFHRLRSGWPVRDIYVSTGVDLYPALHRQLPSLGRAHYILETARRETSAAIGLAAVTLHRRDPKAVMFTANSDHFIKEVPTYVRLMKTAGRVAASHPDHAVLLGITPMYPDTGLGYIHFGRRVMTVQGQSVYQVERFVEKPDGRTAKRYVASKKYLWNPAMFVWRVDSLLDKFRRWLPGSYKILMDIERDIGTPRERQTIKRLFPKMEKISIDYGIMEHDRDMFVIPADFTWADIGTWSAVYTMLADRGSLNVVRGQHIGHDSQHNLVYTHGRKIVATAGLKNMVVVDTPDALLICPRDRAQDVKHLVKAMEEKKLHRYL